MSFKNASIIVVFVFFSSLFYIWQRTQNIRLGYEVSDLRFQCEKLTQENINLQLRISSYLAMEKLDTVAKEKGLLVPDDKDIIYLENK